MGLFDTLEEERQATEDATTWVMKGTWQCMNCGQMNTRYAQGFCTFCRVRQGQGLNKKKCPHCKKQLF